MTTSSRKKSNQLSQRVAIIDEPACIGCTLCIKACPVDAIIGTHHFMHTVIALDCIGCELCIAPCPTDCISMITVQTSRTTQERAQFAIKHRKRRKLRLSAHKQQRINSMKHQREKLKKLIQRKQHPNPLSGRGTLKDSQ